MKWWGQRRESDRRMTVRGLISLVIVRLLAAHRTPGDSEKNQIIDEAIELLQRAREIM